MTSRAVRTSDLLAGHVDLDVSCLDRIYLNGYVPSLQVGGQVVSFLASRGFPIPSPAVVGRIGDQFRASVRQGRTETGMLFEQTMTLKGPRGETLTVGRRAARSSAKNGPGDRLPACRRQLPTQESKP